MNLLYQENKWNFTVFEKSRNSKSMKKSHESTKSMKNYKIINLKLINWIYYIKKRNFSKSLKNQETLNLWKKSHESTMKNYKILNLKLINWIYYI